MKPKSVHQRYALKQQIDIAKQAETMRSLNTELKKSRELAEQLNQIAKQTEIKEGKASAMSLRSASWYAAIVQEQIETTENRNNFLQKEFDDNRKALAKALQKKNKSDEGWHQHQAIERANREEKFEQELANRKRASRGFGK